VGVGVYEARHHQFAGGVNALGAVGRKVRADRHDFLVLDEHVRPETTFGGYDRSPGEKQPAQSSLLSNFGKHPASGRSPASGTMKNRERYGLAE
jgi:hypothetical protein